MILFTLRCAHGHEFEGWFRDGDGFGRSRRLEGSPAPNAVKPRWRRP